MAEGFEPYHVPQQSRRDKLRVVNHHLQPPTVDAAAAADADADAALHPLSSLYDPSSLISSDFITSAANLHRHSYDLSCGVKVEGINLMGFAGGMTGNHIYADPHMSVHLNPSSTIQDINSTPSFVYASPHCYQPFQGNEAAATSGGDGGGGGGGGQSLSLSLSSHHSNLNLPLELNLQRYEKVSEGYIVSCNDGGAAMEVSKSSVPLGPFTGYASVLRASRFLKPAQQLLEELCDVGRGGIYAEKNDADPSLLDPPPLESLRGSETVDDSVNGGDHTRKKSRLLTMLDEVYKRYKQYYQQMQAAVAAFESVAGLSNAAPFANLALKAMSKHFRCLKNAITDQLQFTSKSHGKLSSERDEALLESSGRSSYGQRPFHGGFVDQPVWRPQRGLPERAVTVLRAWLFEHFLHPYPTDSDKIMLAKQTGLSRNQVSNWFINARVRLWKPMVEEIHMLETRQGQKPGQVEEQPPDSGTDHLPTSSSIECENASTSVQRIGDFSLKRNREEPAEGSAGQMKMPYDHSLLHNHHMGAGLTHTGGGGGGGVSLTLGLHQNGVGLPEPYPLNAARRFGLDPPGEGYVVGGGLAAQHRQFGQILHDFVG